VVLVLHCNSKTACFLIMSLLFIHQFWCFLGFRMKKRLAADFLYIYLSDYALKCVDEKSMPNAKCRIFRPVQFGEGGEMPEWFFVPDLWNTIDGRGTLQSRRLDIGGGEIKTTVAVTKVFDIHRAANKLMDMTISTRSFHVQPCAERLPMICQKILEKKVICLWYRQIYLET